MIEFLTHRESDALIAAPDRTRWTGRRDHALLVLAVQTGLRISELCSLTCTDIHLGTGANVTCTGKGPPQTRNTADPTTVSGHDRATSRTRDPARRRPVLRTARPTTVPRRARAPARQAHTTAAATNCPSLTDKHVTMHTLRHTAAMNLLADGVDISVIALWLGHQRTHSTDAYLHADMAIKQAAIDRTRPPNTKPGTYHPEPDILAWLATL